MGTTDTIEFYLCDNTPACHVNCIASVEIILFPD